MMCINGVRRMVVACKFDIQCGVGVILYLQYGKKCLSQELNIDVAANRLSKHTICFVFFMTYSFFIG